VSSTFTRTVIGCVRVRTGFGENWTWSTISRSGGLTCETFREAPGAGAPLCATTAVWFDRAVLEPWLFRAVTLTRSVSATSAEATVYVGSSAFGIATQLLPPALQRVHWYV
jgi:hypothetical protein